MWLEMWTLLKTQRFQVVPQLTDAPGRPRADFGVPKGQV